MSQLLGMLSPLGFASGVSSRNDDDLIDRLSHSYTVLLLIIFSIVVSTKQYVGEPIECWSPAFFSENYVAYTNKVCWVSNTYNLPFEAPVKTPHEPRSHIVYYQWVPMILILQAIFFYTPCVLWRLLSSRSGVDINSLVEAAKSVQETEGRDKTVRYILRNLGRYLVSFRDRRPKGCLGRAKAFMAKRCHFLCGRKYGNYLVGLYLCTKLIYMGNAVAQLFLLNAFLGTEYHMYGLEMLRTILAGEKWEGSQRFPRVTMCDFKVRQMGNVHHYSVQCVLPINLFNEKIFLSLWFWLVLLSLLTGIWLLVTLWRTVLKRTQIHFIKRHLKYMGKLEKSDDKKVLIRFVGEYLRADGVLVLRLINYNTNNLITSEIIAELWDNYLTNPPRWNKRLLRDEDSPPDV